MNIRGIVGLWVLMIFCLFASAQNFQENLDAANTEFRKGNFKEAVELFNSLLASESGDSLQMAYAHGYLGVCLEETGDKKGAISNYKKSISFGIDEYQIYDRAIKLSKAEKNDEVYELALVNGIKTFPETEQEFSKKLAYHYFNNQRYDDLLKVTDVLLSLDISNAIYHYFKGAALQSTGQLEAAEGSYEMALALNPDHLNSNLQYGMILFNKGSHIYESEKKKYESLAKPTRLDYTNYNKAIVKGNEYYKRAEVYLVKYYQNKPNTQVKKALFNLYTRLGDKSKAALYK